MTRPSSDSELKFYDLSHPWGHGVRVSNRARGWRVKVVRLSEAQPYDPPKHHGMTALRLQGFEASPARDFWVGLSHILPGGGADYDRTPLEKVYVVISGQVTVVTETGEATLGPLDSCHLAPDEARSVVNRTNVPASMLVVMPYPAPNPVL